MRDSGREFGADGRGASQRLSTGRDSGGPAGGRRDPSGGRPGVRLDGRGRGSWCLQDLRRNGRGTVRWNRLGGPVEQEREQESLGPATEREQESDGPPTEQEPPGVGGAPLRERGGRDLFFILAVYMLSGCGKAQTTLTCVC